jgi:mono/diheme cytochrome c family protein
LAEQFPRDPSMRRDCLERSLVNPSNGYSTVRLVNYTEAGWGRLSVADFKTRPVTPADLQRPVPSVDGRWRPANAGTFSDTLDDLARRGQELFTRFPAQIERSMISVLREPGGPARYGLWQTPESVGGLVWVALPGGVFPALTCSSCHSTVDETGAYRVGVPNHAFDLGKARDDYVNAKSLYSTWGPGREDIAPDGYDNPVVIADVRTVRFQRYLHRNANVRNSLVALALRIETGLILAHREAVRPDRRDVVALAYYLWTLGDALDTRRSRSHPGRVPFERHCGSCHAGPALAGDAIAAEALLSPVADMPSASRGTGKLRTPSLLGVSSRRYLLYGGEASGIEGLLDPGRRHGGHYVGNDMSDRDRIAIADYLRSL